MKLLTFFRDELQFHKRNPEMFFVWVVFLAVIVLLLNSCSLTFNKDGSKTFTTDGEQIVRAIQIYADK